MTATAVQACCVAGLQVWVVPELRADGKVYWRADSDSQLTKVRGRQHWSGKHAH